MSYDFKEFETKLSEAAEWLTREFTGIRSGRAAPTILDTVQVENYGSFMPVNQVASVTIEDARTLRVAPWDKGVIKEIEKAISNKDLGVSIIVDDAGLRVCFPEVTTEGKQKLVKVAKDRMEEARVRVRQARDETQGAIKSGDLSEDEQFAAKEEMEKRTKAANENLEELLSKKEQEIMS